MVLVVSPFSTQSAAAVVSRQEVKSYLASDAIDQKQRSLFLQAFSSIQTRKDYRDPRSFAQIAAIHGLPNTPYDSFPGNKDGGYCVHGDILFPTWHRPYLALLEKVIRDEALAIAQSYTSDQASWVAAAQSIRLPYWDWADDDSVQGVPRIFTDATVTVQAAPSGASTQIPNPLAAFAVPAEQRQEFPSSLGNINSWPTTVRYPNDSGVSDINELNRNFVQLVPQIRAMTRILFDGTVDDWVDFSNHTMDQRSRRPGNYHSLEFIHDNIHGAIGGGGHMGYPDTAAFDPIFFFHHCNVDRLLAIYESAFNEYVPKSAVTKPLVPFRKAESGNSLADFTWNSQDSYSCSTFGYTYPELTFTGHTLQQAVLAKYAPGHADVAHMPTIPTKPSAPVTPQAPAPQAPQAPAQVPILAPPAQQQPQAAAVPVSPDDSNDAGSFIGNLLRTLHIQAPTFLRQRFGINSNFRTREFNPASPPQPEVEEVFAHISVRRNVFNGPFTLYVNVNGVQAATFFVFARGAPELCANCMATKDEVVSGALDITHSLLKPDGTLQDRSSWGRMVSVTAKKMDGSIIPAAQVPTLKVHLRKSIVAHGGGRTDAPPNNARVHQHRRWDAEDMIHDVLGF